MRKQVSVLFTLTVMIIHEKSRSNGTEKFRKSYKLLDVAIIERIKLTSKSCDESLAISVTLKNGGSET